MKMNWRDIAKIFSNIVKVETNTDELVQRRISCCQYLMMCQEHRIAGVDLPAPAAPLGSQLPAD